MNVLLRMCGGYGAGDIVQMSVVLLHLLAKRPSWVIDFMCRAPYHDLAYCRRGIPEMPVQETPDGKFAVDGVVYERVIDIRLHDASLMFEDRPCTKPVACLHETFGLPYDPHLGRYRIVVPGWAAIKAAPYGRSALIHGMGVSNKHKKDLTKEENIDIKAMASIRLSAGPIGSTLDLTQEPFSTMHPLVLAGIIKYARLFVGIDSGPGHMASSFQTPTLIVWKQHHPAQFHDPAPNTTHLIPENWRTMPPANVRGIGDYFETHYRWRTYAPGQLVECVGQWMREVLK